LCEFKENYKKSLTSHIRCSKLNLLNY